MGVTQSMEGRKQEGSRLLFPWKPNVCALTISREEFQGAPGSVTPGQASPTPEWF